MTPGDEPKRLLIENVGVVHAMYLAENKEQARRLAEDGICGAAFRNFFYHFGFFEAWREPEDEVKYPSGQVMLLVEECTIPRMERADFAYLGSVDDVQRSLDAMVENINPEWFIWQGDQGFLPLDEVKRQVEIFGKKLLPRYQ